MYFLDYICTIFGVFQKRDIFVEKISLVNFLFSGHRVYDLPAQTCKTTPPKGTPPQEGNKSKPRSYGCPITNSPPVEGCPWAGWFYMFELGGHTPYGH